MCAECGSTRGHRQGCPEAGDTVHPACGKVIFDPGHGDCVACDAKRPHWFRVPPHTVVAGRAGGAR